MSEKIRNDAIGIRKLVREAEAVSDEAMIACSRLKQAIVRARQNPQLSVDAGQKALLRLTQAEQQALSLSTNLLRVHDELSRLARETLGPDDDSGTQIAPSAIADDFSASVPSPESVSQADVVSAR
ncbi:hypothetical protein [Tsuneonella mangrovi]|uniref:hypothetical protein n=1 Tax=Tsuneonella mangrovi TaxID=1982042 RepID=UPI00196A2C95|nr:hypothetical protein [Tsuneonella mangrovi]